MTEESILEIVENGHEGEAEIIIESGERISSIEISFKERLKKELYKILKMTNRTLAQPSILSGTATFFLHGFWGKEGCGFWEKECTGRISEIAGSVFVLLAATNLGIAVGLDALSENESKHPKEKKFKEWMTFILNILSDVSGTNAFALSTTALILRTAAGFNPDNPEKIIISEEELGGILIAAAVVSLLLNAHIRNYLISKGCSSAPKLERILNTGAGVIKGFSNAEGWFGSILKIGQFLSGKPTLLPSFVSTMCSDTIGIGYGIWKAIESWQFDPATSDPHEKAAARYTKIAQTDVTLTAGFLFLMTMITMADSPEPFRSTQMAMTGFILAAIIAYVTFLKQRPANVVVDLTEISSRKDKLEEGRVELKLDVNKVERIPSTPSSIEEAPRMETSSATPVDIKGKKPIRDDLSMVGEHSSPCLFKPSFSLPVQNREALKLTFGT